MTLMWALLLLLFALAASDLTKAYEQYQKDKHASILMAHGILLIILGLLVINTTLAAAGSEYELPYYQTHQVTKLEHIIRARGHRLKSLPRRLIQKRRSAVVKDKE